MAKYHSGVPWPKRTITVTNKSAKLTPRQSGFAKRLAKVVKRSIKP
jgi:hypothetical protein